MDILKEIYSYLESYRVVLAEVGLLIVGTYISYILAKRYGLRLIESTVNRTQYRWDNKLYNRRVFHALVPLIPAFIAYYGMDLFPSFAKHGKQLVNGYTIIVLIVFTDRLLSALTDIYGEHPISYKRPIKGYIQLVKLFVYIFGGLIAFSFIAGKSPWGFLSGIGALTAVLMLVFRDTILNFVASLLIILNDLVHVGDWIEVPELNVDGDVEEMALHTIKIRNFDKTIVTIPTRKLIDGSFKNWRGMQESGGRRIMRSLFIDQSSVGFLSADDIERLKGIAVLREYIEDKQAELKEYNSRTGGDHDSINSRRLTNLGTFRAYVGGYLRNKEEVRDDMTFLIRQLPPSEHGVPIQVYVFANTIDWAEYEAIQADIFDHLIAVVPEFGLRIFQYPSGADLKALGGQK
ncbi:mechanosensitive ion channel family protein [Limisalsivibrio acetivorans]|uniref:mechanosensitive ion channel family protein n=1 Tax=Limisalsivibrio acetivorans TaxID=1304888 RepID=UPI0003B66216|nr:mechanosensitive ion channel domain-containing protein [Limisalsivibrio acetivorans]